MPAIEDFAAGSNSTPRSTGDGKRIHSPAGIPAQEAVAQRVR